MIRTTLKLDREARAVYHLTVIASPDDGRLHWSSSSSVTINVADVNDNNPQFRFPPPTNNETVAISSFATLDHMIANIKVETENQTA